MMPNYPFHQSLFSLQKLVQMKRKECDLRSIVKNMIFSHAVNYLCI